MQSRIHNPSWREKISLPVTLACAFLFFAATIDGEAYSTGGGLVVTIKQNGRFVTYALLVIYAVFVAIGARFSRRAPRAPSGTIAFLLFLLLYAIKLAVSGLVERSFLLFGITALYFFLFGFYTIKPYQKFRPSLGDIVVAAGGAGTFIILANLAFVLSTDAVGYRRLSGLSYNANSLGYSMAIFSIFIGVFLQYVLHFKTLQILALIILLAAGFYLVAGTHSRGAFALMGGSILINGWFIFKGRSRILLLPVCLYMIYIFFSDDIMFYSTSVFSNRVDTRHYIWDMQLSTFLENPFFGEDLETERVRFRENAYLGVASKLGFLGLVCIVYVLLGSLVDLFRLWSDKNCRPFTKYFSMLSIVAIFVLIVACWFEALIVGVIGPSIFLVLLINSAVRNERYDLKRAVFEQKRAFGGRL